MDTTDPANASQTRFDLEAVQAAVDHAAPPSGMQPDEIVSAPEEVIPYGNVAVYGETVITGLPGSPVGPLSATTLAEGGAAGVPAEAIGYTDAAGNFVSALTEAIFGSSILTGLAVLGIAVAVGAGVYFHYHPGVLNAKQAEHLVDQIINPNDDAVVTPALPDQDLVTKPPTGSKGAPPGVPANDNSRKFVDPLDNDAMDQLGFMMDGKQYFENRSPGAWERFKAKHPDYENLTWNAYALREGAKMKREDTQEAHQACDAATEQRVDDLKSAEQSYSESVEDCNSIKDPEVRSSCLSSVSQANASQVSAIAKTWTTASQQHYCGHDEELSQMLDKRYGLDNLH